LATPSSNTFAKVSSYRPPQAARPYQGLAPMLVVKKIRDGEHMVRMLEDGVD
jgi:hypothetical protein